MPVQCLQNRHLLALALASVLSLVAAWIIRSRDVMHLIHDVLCPKQAHGCRPWSDIQRRQRHKPYTLTVLVSIVLVCFVNTYHPSPQSTQFNKPKILNDNIHTKNLLSLLTQNEAF